MDEFTPEKIQAIHVVAHIYKYNIYMRLYKRQAARIQGYFWKLKDFSGVIWIHLTQWKKVITAEKE